MTYDVILTLSNKKFILKYISYNNDGWFDNIKVDDLMTQS